MKLLVCIAAHYAPERVQYLKMVLAELETYEWEVKIIIDSQDFIPNYHVWVHYNMVHPFRLTQMHRQHFKDNLYNYDWFMYLEDDILLPWQNFLSYTEKFPLMWPNYVPSFIRIEQKDGQSYISDVIQKHKADQLIQLGDRFFTFFPFPQNYHAFWIAPQYVLKETIIPDFTKLHDSREKAASYLIWELNKKGLIEIETDSNGKWQIKEDCYSWHLPNNYIDSSMPNGKIKVKEVFI